MELRNQNIHVHVIWMLDKSFGDEFAHKFFDGLLARIEDSLLPKECFPRTLDNRGFFFWIHFLASEPWAPWLSRTYPFQHNSEQK